MKNFMDRMRSVAVMGVAAMIGAMSLFVGLMVMSWVLMLSLAMIPFAAVAVLLLPKSARAEDASTLEEPAQPAPQAV